MAVPAPTMTWKQILALKPRTGRASGVQAEAISPPAPHVMLEDAMGHLGVVIRYGLDAITDQIDRDHIVAAHELIVALWKAHR